MNFNTAIVQAIGLIFAFYLRAPRVLHGGNLHSLCRSLHKRRKNKLNYRLNTTVIAPVPLFGTLPLA
jgi:hypothetical protein